MKASSCGGDAGAGVSLSFSLFFPADRLRVRRLERPLILPIYLSAPAHNLAMLTSYDAFCFMRYVHGGVGVGVLGGSLPRLPMARLPGAGVPGLTRLWGTRREMRDKDMLVPRTRTPTPTPILPPALASLTPPLSPIAIPRTTSPVGSPVSPAEAGAVTPPSLALASAPHSPSRARFTSSSSSTSSTHSWSSHTPRPLHALAEACYFHAQNVPSVVLLLPRAAVCVVLVMSLAPESAVRAAVSVIVCLWC
jgi:hypothetical protein